MILLLFALACSGGTTDKGAPVETGQSQTHTGETASTGETSDSNAGPIGPSQAHAEPTDGVLCFDCHLCGNDDATTVETTHWVCVDCHRGPDGSVPDEVQSGCGCGALDCDTTPPTLPCAECHVVDGTNGMPSAQHMNGLCDACHAAGTSAPAP